MMRKNITILCYWDGNMSYDPEGLYYDREYKRVIKVSKEITYNQLMDKLYLITGADMSSVMLNFFCRYPSIIER